MPAMSSGDTRVGTVPAALWMARTSGTWRSAGEYGYYRVLVQRRVGEAALDSVFFEVLVADKISGDLKVVRSVPIARPGYAGNVVDVDFFPRGDTEIAITLDIAMKGMDGLIQREVYLFGPTREPRLLVPAKYIDLDR
jgi:hypothetical protein